MAELADALVSGISEETHAGSSPVVRTRRFQAQDSRKLVLGLIHLRQTFQAIQAY